MSNHRVSITAVVLIVLAAGCGSAVPAPRGLDLAGQVVDPLAEPRAAVTVLVFLDTECPIANRYAPDLREIHDEYAPRGMRMWLIYADPARDPASIREHQKAFDYRGTVLRDPEHRLVALTGATVTPEAVVFDATGKRVYRGRINDKFVDFGKTRPAATTHDLIDAIEATLESRPVAQSETTAVGCFIPELSS